MFCLVRFGLGGVGKGGGAVSWGDVFYFFFSLFSFWGVWLGFFFFVCLFVLFCFLVDFFLDWAGFVFGFLGCFFLGGGGGGCGSLVGWLVGWLDGWFGLLSFVLLTTLKLGHFSCK